MSARPSCVLLLVADSGIESRICNAVESLDLACLLTDSVSELFDRIEANQPKLVCLEFDGHQSPAAGLVQLLLDLFPRLSLLLVSKDPSTVSLPDQWMGRLAVCSEPTENELSRRIAWCLCADASKPQALPTDTPFLIGRSQAMLQVFEAIDRTADSHKPILIQGEYGTGKHLTAFTLHCRSSRCARTIHTLDCMEIDDPVLESLLFGPPSNDAFPPMLCDPQIGTIVLSELAGISPSLQAYLIDWFRNHDPAHQYPQVIITTARDLGRLVADRKVRPDLFLELSNQVIGLPPLRHRPADIRLLVDHFAQHINRCLERLQKSPLNLQPDHYRELENYSWLGNVRELRSTMLAMAFSQDIQVVDLLQEPDPREALTRPTTV